MWWWSNIKDYTKVVKASEHHEVNEDIGENISFHKPRKSDVALSLIPVDNCGHTLDRPEEFSGSERLQLEAALERSKTKRTSSNRPKPWTE